jgi:DNA-binding LytR/AlgR family response regulator
MNVVIIEDEVQTAWDVQHCIKALRPSFIIKAILDSVESSIQWFSNHEAPDLIISDIKLGDGIAFEIFKRIQITCPIIFCTAYDEFAIQAFQNNGIDYLLKPINEKLFEQSLNRIESLARTLRHSFDSSVLDTLMAALEAKETRYKRNFLVAFRNRMIPIRIEEIAFFSIDNNKTILHTMDNKKYTMNDTLEQLETTLDPKIFFRANRQFFIAFHAVKQIEHYHGRKLLVETCLPDEEPITVSKAKSTEFLLWMENR